MPTDIWKIPLDNNGCVRGTYRLRHKTDVSDTLGTVTFERGLSMPLTGQPLIHFVAALGADVDLVPDDDAAREAMGAATLPEPEPPQSVLEAAGASEDERAARVAELAATESAPRPTMFERASTFERAEAAAEEFAESKRKKR